MTGGEAKSVINAINGLGQTLKLIFEAMRTMDQRLVKIEEACTAEHPPSKTEEQLEKLVEEVSHGNEMLREIGDSVSTLVALHNDPEGKGE